ncbi:putative phosphoesterase, ICC [Desulfomonile tiedjei DSM 6799]|uniref:Putative phosphoesterase, ICC n=2 Tax=Desulfomonile tiedjei TaxID=2358 RepID=I4C0R6_DESTA|nr:putative phosphoesterase, ICC [Desulfomonile tiedjei DSM 6799]
MWVLPTFPAPGCHENNGTFTRIAIFWCIDMNELKREIVLAGMADLHFKRNSQGSLKQVFLEISREADVLLLCGDITEAGYIEEARALVDELKALSNFPVIAVLGNHDFEQGKETEIRKLFRRSGMMVLDGETCEFYGVGFAGVKGFGGGFGNRALQPWGEQIIKQFVNAAIKEATSLESALAKLRTKRKIVLLHYSPIRETVRGEDQEIFPYLGSSRLEDPLNRYSITAVFHGHSHHGTHEGKTANGTPVYNVALGVLARNFPENPFYRLVRISLE